VALLQTNNLTKIYNNRLIAVNGVNLAVEPGWVFGLLGPNGAGKTTMLKLVMGLQSPTAGSVTLFGDKVSPNSSNVRQRIGYLPTNPKFPPTLTPIGYLDLVGQLFGMDAGLRKPRLAALLRAVDLLGAAAQPIKTLSTGMTTRLGIAAALMNDPELLIWDEPTAGLDPAARKYTLDLIRELGQEKTIIVSSHILSDIDRVCDHVGIMHDGKVIYCGSVADLKRTIGRNTIEVELDGPEARLASWEAEARVLPPVRAVQRTGPWASVALDPDATLAAPLASLLALATQHELEVLSVTSARAQTEDAFLQLLEADQANGFSRAYSEMAPAGDGAVGAVQS
jgi:ABC-2 type transport system ATP-binding protein